MNYIRVFQKDGTNRLNISTMKGDLLGELVHMSMEAKKSHNRSSSSWRPRDASRMTQSKCDDFRTREANGVHNSSV
jgi:hypothetical protein